MNLVIRLLITAASAFLLSRYFLPGVHFKDFGTAIGFAVVLGLLNIFVRPIFNIIGLPITIITFGLFSLVINAAIILIADYFLEGMKVDGFGWALIFGVCLSVITSLLGGIFED